MARHGQSEGLTGPSPHPSSASISQVQDADKALALDALGRF
jgi:hypothetical protein